MINRNDVHYTEWTAHKAFQAICASGVTPEFAEKIIAELTKAGIVFRERGAGPDKTAITRDIRPEDEKVKRSKESPRRIYTPFNEKIEDH